MGWLEDIHKQLEAIEVAEDNPLEYRPDPQKSAQWRDDRLGMFTASRFGDMMRAGRSYKSSKRALEEAVQLQMDWVNGKIKQDIRDLRIEISEKLALNKGVKRLQDRFDKLMGYRLNEINEQLELAKQAFGDQQFGDTCLSYIFENIAEVLTGAPHEAYSNAIIWGQDHEEEALDAYAALTKNEVVRTGFIKYNEYSGGSPDGNIGDKGQVEVKCPYNSAIHAKTLIRKEICDDDYKWQVQGNLMISGREWCDFVSYDPRIQTKKHRIVVVRVGRDEEMIQQLNDRLPEVKGKMDELLTAIL